MTPKVEEAVRFLRLAQRDRAAFALPAAAAEIDDAIACFHAQQSAEMALKTVLCLRGIEYRRTHDLEELGGMLADAGLSPPVGVTDLRRRTSYLSLRVGKRSTTARYQTRPRSERELGRWASCVRQRTGQGRRRCAYWTYLRTAARVYPLEDNLRG